MLTCVKKDVRGVPEECFECLEASEGRSKGLNGDVSMFQDRIFIYSVVQFGAPDILSGSPWKLL